MTSSYNRKRRFDETTEPPASFRGDVDPGKAKPGDSFVIHQHYATRLHFDLRLEMFNGRTPVLVSWAVPKGMPRRKGKGALAIHVEDHPFEYGSFSGSIPEGNYGAGEVRILDAGSYEVLEQKPGNIRFRLDGRRLKGIYRLVETRREGGKEQWLAFLSEDARPRPDPMPSLQPMLATLVREPFDDDDWAFEPKWDGMRAAAICDEATRLVSRNAKDVTEAYPELNDMHLRLVALDAVVDGEIVAFEDGVPSFEKLQSRIHVRNERDIERLMKTTPVAYVAFDLLYLDGRDLTARPYSERRELLEETVVPTDRFQISPAVDGMGTALFDAAREQGLEGIVAKKRSSRYEPGKRSKFWLKVKTTFEADLVVAGWSEGKRAGVLGSLVLAAYDDGRLRYVGGVGTGLTEQSRGMVQHELEAIAEDDTPFTTAEMKGKPELRHAHWVRPERVVVVEFRQLTSAGMLRAPSFKGLRDDKPPEECTFDDLRRAAGPSD
ncbi:MAG TPA: non-homologous end-joining DNA ligase [Actinomycetota bacterium]|nr:non-homologous end-joining DNA ligase [Actinomycetota bacterium]